MLAPFLQGCPSARPCSAAFGSNLQDKGLCCSSVLTPISLMDALAAPRSLCNVSKIHQHEGLPRLRFCSRIQLAQDEKHQRLGDIAFAQRGWGLGTGHCSVVVRLLLSQSHSCLSTTAERSGASDGSQSSPISSLDPPGKDGTSRRRKRRRYRKLGAIGHCLDHRTKGSHLRC